MSLITMTPLTAVQVEKYAKTFKDIGLNVPLFEEFFECIGMITGIDDRSPLDRMREVIGDFVLKGKDDLNRFAEAYFGYYNAIVALLESFNESRTAKKQIALVEKLYRGFETHASDEDFKGIMEVNALKNAAYLVGLSGIDIRSKKGIDPDVMREELGEYLFNAFDHLMLIGNVLNEDKLGNDGLKEIFLGIVADSHIINEDRKANFDSDDCSESETYHKNPSVGRNDPCPCGSGRKYKKCCLEKDENPFHDLLPVNPPLPRLSDQEIREFYGLLNIFMKHAWGMMNDADVTTIDDFCVTKANGEFTMNSEYMRDIPVMSDLFQFIKVNCAKIVRACVKTTGKDSMEGKLLSSWKLAVLDHFLVLEKASQGCAIFWGQNKSGKSELFLVYGLYDNVSIITGQFPSLGEAILLPYKGRIVAGGFFMESGITFKRGFVNTATDEYIEMRKEKSVLMILG